MAIPFACKPSSESVDVAGQRPRSQPLLMVRIWEYVMNGNRYSQACGRLHGVGLPTGLFRYPWRGAPQPVETTSTLAERLDQLGIIPDSELCRYSELGISVTRSQPASVQAGLPITLWRKRCGRTTPLSSSGTARPSSRCSARRLRGSTGRRTSIRRVLEHQYRTDGLLEQF